MKKSNRPLSPHLQVYKLPLTGLISITHRMTGVILAGGLLFFLLAIFAIANGSESFALMQDVMNTVIARLIYWGFVYALFFHLCHGVRHLIWDTGQSFELETLDRYAWIELIASLTLTGITFLLF